MRMSKTGNCTNALLIFIHLFLVHLFSQMTSWICTEVLTRDTPAARAVVLEHFINMAMICYKHNDMHCALCITVALCCTPIKRLAKSWDCLERKVIKTIVVDELVG